MCILVLSLRNFSTNAFHLITRQLLSQCVWLKQGSSENDGRSDVYDRSEFKVVSYWCYPNCGRANCGHFEKEFWMNFDHIGPFWTIFGPLCTIFNFFVTFWTLLDKIRAFWTILDHIGAFWTTLDLLDHFEAFWQF